MKTPIRLAFAGFRHPHIFDLRQRALSHPDIVISGAWENDVAASLLPGRNIATTHKSVDALLADCDAVAIGDCYGRRGPLVAQALRAGKHVIADKPLCTSLSELEEIRSLVAAGDRRIGMMLDMRDAGNLIALREMVRSGRIGTVQTVEIAGQHPLKWGTRPAWYFKPGMHGGTLNDLAIHATDFIPWVTGLQITGIDAARTWNAKATEAPHFKDCAQFMLRLSNNGGVMGDVSYLAPDKCGYSMPHYWRISLHGARGLAETAWNVPGVLLAEDTSDQPQMLPPAEAQPGGYLKDFLADLAGHARPDGLTTASCLAATELALELQARADK
jgi:predicted dehydrogenase